jgi:uncharacterized protein
MTATKLTGINSLIRSILFLATFIFLLFLSSSSLGQLFPAKWERFVYGTLGTISALLATWLFLKTEKKSFSKIGLVWEPATIIRFFKGFLIGTVIFIIIIILLLGFTELQLEKDHSPRNTWAAFWYLSIIPLALMEEIAFRAYPFLKLNKAFGLRVTQIIIAISFALYHIIGGWNVQSAFLGPGIWAFVFGLSAAWSGGIAVPTGIHVALNVLQPLVGMKSGSYESIWILKYKEGTAENLIARADNIGLAIQLLIFICAVVLTEYYIGKKKTQL